MSSQPILACSQDAKYFTNYDLLVGIYDSAIATQFNLKSSTLNVLNGLCRYYNHKTNKVFPGINKLADKINLNERTIRLGINELVKNGLILKSKSGCHNEYLFTNKFFDAIKTPAGTSAKVTTKSGKKLQNKAGDFTAEQNNIKQNKLSSCENIASDKKHDDDISFKNSEGSAPEINSKQEYKKLLDKLGSWNFTGSHFVIKKYGMDRVRDLCKLVEDKNPDNEGAYLRSLLNLPYDMLTINKKSNSGMDRIKRLLNDSGSYLNNFAYAEHLLNSIEIINGKIKESDIRILVEIQIKWNIPSSKYFTLQYLEQISANNISIANYLDTCRSALMQIMDSLILVL